MWGPCWRMAMIRSPSFRPGWRFWAWFMPDSTARMACRGVNPA